MFNAKQCIDSSAETSLMPPQATTTPLLLLLWWYTSSSTTITIFWRFFLAFFQGQAKLATWFSIGCQAKHHSPQEYTIDVARLTLKMDHFEGMCYYLPLLVLVYCCCCKRNIELYFFFFFDQKKLYNCLASHSVCGGKYKSAK